MKALSIHQPWAWAILHAGKAIENRSWATSYRGPLLIHASKSRASYDAQNPDVWRERYGVELPEWDTLIKGAILGTVDLDHCFEAGTVNFAKSTEKWIEGPWCWLLHNPKPFAEPIPYRGAQGLFDVPDTILNLKLRG